MTTSRVVHSGVMLLVIVAMSSRHASAQAQLHLPFDRASQTLKAPEESLSTVILKRTCRLTVSLRGATRADVRSWKFSIGDVPMQGPVADDQPAVYNARIPQGAADSLTLTLSGAPQAAVDSLGTINLHVTTLAPGKQCTQTTGGGEPTARPAPRSTSGFPPVYDRSRRMANLRFNSFGLPDTNARGRPEKFPVGITDNDVITVLLDLPDTIPDVGQYSVQISGNIKGEDVNIVGQGDLTKLASLGLIQGAEAEVVGSSLYSMGTFGPYSAPQVTIRITRLVDGKTVVDRSYTVRVRRTYIAALRLGVGRTGVRFRDFQVGPRSASDTTRIIRDVSHDHEVRPYLTLVFYGWRFWERGFWDGRDIEAEPTLSERLNPMVGAGLKKLGDEWLLGLSFEVARGLDVNLAYQAARVNVLQSGFRADSVFAGTGTAPTSKDWQYGAVIGASLDLRAAVSVLSGLLSNNK